MRNRTLGIGRAVAKLTLEGTQLSAAVSCLLSKAVEEVRQQPGLKLSIKGGKGGGREDRRSCRGQILAQAGLIVLPPALDPDLPPLTFQAATDFRHHRG